MIEITWASVYDDPVYGKHNIAIIENKILLAAISKTLTTTLLHHPSLCLLQK